MLDREEKIEILKSLMWDYDLTPENCLAVLEGKIERIGHYDAENIFKKTLESFPWYMIIELIPLVRIQQLLNDKVIQHLRTKQLIARYEFIRTRLSKAI